MKTPLLTVFALAAASFFTNSTFAQTNYQQLMSFGASSSSYPQAGLIKGADGNLYGTTLQGGSSGGGTVFKLNPDGTGFTILQNFDYSTFGRSPNRTGSSPQAGLIQGADGALYGTTVYGGSTGVGTVFKVNTNGTGYTVLLNFDLSTTGGRPQAGLIQGADGALYGTTIYGGSSGAGTVFKVNTNGTGFTVLLNFDGSTTGGYPLAGLIQGADGALYGTALGGGSSGGGTVFKLNPNGTGFTVLLNFEQYSSTTGAFPYAGLIQGADGALYGTTVYGGSGVGGTVFKLNPDGTGFTVLLNFDGSTTGGVPQAGLIQGADGGLYGTTSQGGSTGGGTVFKLNPDGTGFTVLLNFDPSTTKGFNPQAGLIQGADGGLYGTAFNGGSSGGGTVFKLNPDGTGFTVLLNFDPSTKGAVPYAGLIQGADGALYGTTSQGGSTGGGTVFKLNPDGTGFTVLLNFDYSPTGGYLPARLMQGADGALYGTTYSGGSSDYGTVFKVNTNGTGFTVLLNFDGSATGRSPQAGLIQGADGALYGTASSGGSSGVGTVFKLNPDGTGFTVLLDFNLGGFINLNSAHPVAGLIKGADGALYGTAAGVSPSGGAVFKLNPDGTGFNVLLGFGASNGYPAGLISGADGALYGTHTGGGSSGGGTVFKLNPDGTGFNVLLNFDGSTTGGSPNELMQGADGALYGTTFYGGSSGGGTVFKLNPDGTGFSVILNFDPSTIGAYPFAGLIQGADGNLYGTTTGGGEAGVGTVFKLVPPSAIQNLIPSQTIAGAGNVHVTIYGVGFQIGARVFFGDVEVATTYVSPTQLQVIVHSTALPSPVDFAVVKVTVLSPSGDITRPAAFTVIGTGVSGAVSQVDSGVAGVGETVSVLDPPSTPDSAGVTALLQHTGGTAPATVTVATYTANPTPATAFEAGGGFVDLQVSGADPGDQLSSAFYYPQTVTDAAETATTLKFFNGTDWIDVLSSGGAAPAKDTTDDLDGTVSGGRFQVVFDNTSRPQITQLNGTVFAIAAPDTRPLTFSGFLAPISGADSTGGSFAAPVRTFKAGSTIPVKFNISRGNAPVTTGIHRLQAIKYSNATTGGTPIDATPQDAATTGNQFRLSGNNWAFNLDTKSSGITIGIWQLVATLSDGSQHAVWVQIK